jgi:hypothetical protein
VVLRVIAPLERSVVTTCVEVVLHVALTEQSALQLIRIVLRTVQLLDPFLFVGMIFVVVLDLLVVVPLAAEEHKSIPKAYSLESK